jgi:phosphatidylglycerol:prolipoprotein diacylglycerol transferase
MAAFPYVTDVVNAVLGTHMSLPVPVFGTIVAIAMVVATSVATRAVKKYEELGELPSGTHSIVVDTACVSGLVGIVGARVFSIFDNISGFIADPISTILTRSGFWIYGGLCFGLVAGAIFVRRRSIPVIPMLDAVAPSMMLGYGIGRLGCQIAGDGDWGIFANMSLKPSWVPDWLWAQTYDGNIVGAVIKPPGVYPTPIYETIMALAIFCGLWLLQSNRNRPGYLFSVYLLAVGFERLLIEKIRINERFEVFGGSVTQAEAISFTLVIMGLIGVLGTLRTSHFWAKAIVSAFVLSALTACASR